MYLLILALAYIFCYFVLTILFQKFFNFKEKAKYKLTDIIIVIILFFLVINSLGFIKNPEFANRFLHAIGGGFIFVIIIYQSLIASNLKINKIQYISISFFITSTFGVINELAESILQIKFNLNFAPNINDTWLDLWSNTIGIILGIIIILTIYGKKFSK